MPVTQTRLIVGCGYLGQRVAQRWQERGDTVYAVTRNPKHAEAFRQRGWYPVVGDITEPATLQDLPAADTVLIAVGFDRSRYGKIHDVYVHGVATLSRPRFLIRRGD